MFSATKLVPSQAKKKLLQPSQTVRYVPPVAKAGPRRMPHRSSLSALMKNNEKDLKKPVRQDQQQQKDDGTYVQFLTLDMFDIGKPLGNGKFGNVYLVKYKKYNYVCALKIVFKKQLAKCGMGLQMKREIEMQSHLNHPNILKLLGFFEDSERWFLVLEYCKNGELYGLLQKAGRFEEKRAARYIKSTTEALKCCSDNFCIHRDLKPENIMVDHNDQIKLADFGWSVRANTKRTTYCGTLDYLSPEIINEKYYDGAVDRWCLGVLTYELCVGEPPFQSGSKDALFNKVRSARFEYPKFLSKECKDFIGRLIKVEPTERMTYEQCLSHPWIVNNVK
ncbi:serine/threonine protein kinase, putative [Entamoeba invadens IP1]|uniref:Aurora kinase n=1 Tax=Entamoeba invadens IP1 TaxID=370355 RepID=A0A0A1TZB6_ENTIV|nr:serine/threonine protein kinase, putative [Entamoeba invadens IP1]ELP86935.1 serine/threonine protein kinase, putative [Entamoeba invadens IP1]|eukprot:XP_004253706.1 serine/threonine protein kinase, putative [Entamoeba invadens IP1]